eukprot:746570-Rhodomonas_salina.5
MIVQTFFISAIAGTGPYIYHPTCSLCNVRCQHRLRRIVLRTDYERNATSTEIGHAYARATRCPVLTSAMLLPGSIVSDMEALLDDPVGKIQNILATKIPIQVASTRVVQSFGYWLGVLPYPASADVARVPTRIAVPGRHVYVARIRQSLRRAHVSGTQTAYCAVCLRACYAMHGTDLAFAGTRRSFSESG